MNLDPAQQYLLAVRTAVVSGVLALLVAALLLVDYRARVAEDPLNTTEYAALKDRLSVDPQDDTAKVELRELDDRLREEYFHRRRFTNIGAWMLVVSLAVALGTMTWAASLRYQLPEPEPREEGAGPEQLAAQRSRWSVAVCGMLVVGASLVLYAATPDIVPPEGTLVSGLDETQRFGLDPFPVGPPIDGTGTSTPDKDVASGDLRPEGDQPKATLPALPEGMPTAEDIARNWPRFRGPGGLGIATYKNLPTAWDVESGDGVLWKAEVPVPGNGSVIVWNQHVFLTGATEEKRVVMAFDAASGRPLWETEIPGTDASTAEVPEISEATGLAACTPVTDGRCVYAMFANGDLGAVDFSGNVRWTRSLGIPENVYGHAASLAMVRDRVIVQLDQAGPKDGLSKLIALDAASGETVWETPREVANSWPTPIVIDVNGKSQIITDADPWVIAYSAEDGQEVWRAECLQGDVGPSPTYADGIVFVANEFPGAAAIRADGTGNVTDTHVLWEADWGAPDCCSPLATDEWVLLLASYGILTCYDATQGGEPLWEEEFDATFVSSPAMAGDNIYLFDEEGKVWVVRASKDSCERVSATTIGEKCVTSPAFQSGRLYIRGENHLFCFSDAAPPSSAPEKAPADEELVHSWPRFRGPGGLGIAPYKDIPTTWNAAAGEGVLWKTEVPVPGNGSAIVWDQHVFLSGATEEKRVVMGFDADSGTPLWETEIPGTDESTAEVPEVMEATGLAAPTPVTDGRCVYAIFANGDVGAVDFSGKLQWARSMGIPKNVYGHGSSLAMHQDRLILQFDQGGKSDGLSRVLALDATTGKTVWETPREIPNSWPTPIVIDVDGKSQIITAADPWVIAYSAEDGQEVWRAECLQGDVGPSPTYADGIVFVANEFPGAAAIRADGTGNVTDTHVLWEADWGAPDCCSPLATGEWVLLLASYGTLTCYDAGQGGEPLWEEDFDDASFVSSPAMAGEHIYLFDEEGKVWVIRPTRDSCERISTASLDEPCVTSPAFQPGRLYIRGEKHLFCIGER